MAQLNFYVPQDLEKKIREQARSKGKSVSSYLADIVKIEIKHQKWQKDFFKIIVGGWKDDFPKIDRPPPESSDRW